MNRNLINCLVNENIQKGEYKTKWNGIDKYRKEVKTGVYFVTLKTSNKLIHQIKIMKR